LATKPPAARQPEVVVPLLKHRLSLSEDAHDLSRATGGIGLNTDELARDKGARPPKQVAVSLGRRDRLREERVRSRELAPLEKRAAQLLGQLGQQPGHRQLDPPLQ